MKNSLKKWNFSADFILWALPFVLALSYVFVRQHLHLSYPKNDAAEYAYSSQILYADYIENDKKIDLDKLYSIRDFRRTAYPLFIFANLLLFDDHLIRAIDFTALTLWTLFLIYSLLICRQLIGGPAGLFTYYLIATFPSFLSTAFTGTLELPLLCCMSGVSYHFLKSKNFSNTLHTHILGILITIGILFRPTELFAVLFGLYLYLIVKHKLVTPLVGLAFVISAAIKLNAYPSAMTALFVIILFLMSAELFFKKLFKLFSLFLLPYFVLTTWYYTSFQSIWDWIYVHNFTAESALTGKRLGLTLGEFWLSLYLRWGGNTLILVSAAAIYILIKSQKNLNLKNYLLFLLPLLTLVFFGSFTNNGDPRYYYTGIFAAFVGFGFFKKTYYSNLVSCLLLIAISLQMTFNYLEITDSKDRKLRQKTFSLIRPRPLWPYEPIIFYPEKYEPLPNVAAELKLLLPKEKTRVLVVTVQQTQMVSYLFESVTLSVVSKDIIPLHEFVHSQSGPSDIEVLKKQFDYILMGPLNLKFAEQQNDFVRNILSEYKTNLNDIHSNNEINIFSAEYRSTKFKYSLIKL